MNELVRLSVYTLAWMLLILTGFSLLTMLVVICRQKQQQKINRNH